MKIQTMADIDSFISPELQQSNGLSEHNLAMFLAQCDHETQGFTQLVENLNYTTDARLIAIFPNYFNKYNVANYVGDPQAIANKVYANRMGNGIDDSGDGWRFRGAGYLMITGRENYTAFSKHWGYNGILTADIVCKNKLWCLHTALFMWKLLSLANCDITTCTRRLNGGLHGLTERTDRLNYYLGIVD